MFAAAEAVPAVERALSAALIDTVAELPTEPAAAAAAVEAAAAEAVPAVERALSAALVDTVAELPTEPAAAAAAVEAAAADMTAASSAPITEPSLPASVVDAVVEVTPYPVAGPEILVVESASHKNSVDVPRQAKGGVQSTVAAFSDDKEPHDQGMQSPQRAVNQSVSPRVGQAQPGKKGVRKPRGFGSRVLGCFTCSA